MLLGCYRSSGKSKMPVDHFCLYIRGTSVNWSLYLVVCPGVLVPWVFCLPLPPVACGNLSKYSKIHFSELLPSLFWYQAFMPVSSSLLRCSCSHLFLAYPAVKQHVLTEFQYYRHWLHGPLCMQHQKLAAWRMVPETERELFYSLFQVVVSSYCHQDLEDI